MLNRFDISKFINNLVSFAVIQSSETMIDNRGNKTGLAHYLTTGVRTVHQSHHNIYETFSLNCPFLMYDGVC